MDRSIGGSTQRETLIWINIPHKIIKNLSEIVDIVLVTRYQKTI